MKAVVWPGLLLLLAACQGGNKEVGKPPQRVADEKALPGFEIQEEIHNFGTLRVGEAVIFTFEYRNSGSGILEIAGAESGCGCLTVEPEEKLILPGDTGRVKVVFDTSGLYGKQFQSFRVLSSRQDLVLDLAVTAEVINDNIEVKQQ